MTNGEIEAGVRGGLWSNWGADDADYKATVWNVRTWGVWCDGDQ